MLRLLLFLGISFGILNSAPLKRCEQYAQDERKAFGFYFGLDFPVQYALAQIQQESACRQVVSNDGYASSGLSQVVWRMWQQPLQKQGIQDLKTTSNQLKAQAYINYLAYKQVKTDPKKLWIMYQIYNGGGLVNKEIARAGKADWQSAKDACRRGYSTFKLKNGTIQKRSNCDINYEYSPNIFKIGKDYEKYGSQVNTYIYW